MPGGFPVAKSLECGLVDSGALRQGRRSAVGGAPGCQSGVQSLGGLHRSLSAAEVGRPATAQGRRPGFVSCLATCREGGRQGSLCTAEPTSSWSGADCHCTGRAHNPRASCCTQDLAGTSTSRTSCSATGSADVCLSRPERPRQLRLRCVHTDHRMQHARRGRAHELHGRAQRLDFDEDGARALQHHRDPKVGCRGKAPVADEHGARVRHGLQAVLAHLEDAHLHQRACLSQRRPAAGPVCLQRHGPCCAGCLPWAIGPSVAVLLRGRTGALTCSGWVSHTGILLGVCRLPSESDNPAELAAKSVL